MVTGFVTLSHIDVVHRRRHQHNQSSSVTGDRVPTWWELSSCTMSMTSRYLLRMTSGMLPVQPGWLDTPARMVSVWLHSQFTTATVFVLTFHFSSVLRSGTDFILLLIWLLFFLFFVLFGQPLQNQNSLRLCRFKSFGMKFGRNVLQVNVHRLTESVFDFTSKVLPPAVWTRCVCWRLFSSVCQFLIYSTFAFVLFIAEPTDI